MFSVEGSVNLDENGALSLIFVAGAPPLEPFHLVHSSPDLAALHLMVGFVCHRHEKHEDHNRVQGQLGDPLNDRRPPVCRHCPPRKGPDADAPETASKPTEERGGGGQW